MSILSKKEIIERLNTEKENSIVVTPILDKEGQINQIGIDCRLSNQFIIFKSQSIESFDIERFFSHSDRYLQKEVIIPFGNSFILHPQTMVLGSTFEFISLPSDIAALIEVRSSWARIGLMVSFASYIEPGFKGCLTFELSNVSNIPIKLFPGLRIGQLLFDKTTSDTEYEYKKKKYIYPIGPESTKIEKDADIPFFMEFNNHDK